MCDPHEADSARAQYARPLDEPRPGAGQATLTVCLQERSSILTIHFLERVGSQQQSEDSQDQEGQETTEESQEERAPDAEPSEEETGEDQEAQQAQADSDEAERDQAMEQWLRRVPDDPSGLLREKFRYESRQRQQQEGRRDDEAYW